MSLRAAVVGSSFGARIHVPALRAAGFAVVALVGQDPERTRRRAERLGIEHPCTSLDDAVALGLDAVSIATPPATHAPLAEQALDAGCHVLCEKPFTLDVAEAARLAEKAGTAQRVGHLGHEFRWSTDQAVIEWAVDEGLIGSPKLAFSISTLSMLRGFSMPDWWYDPSRGGGWLGASGSHRIDATRQWFGEIEALSAGLPTVSEPTLGIDDSFDIRLVTRSGVHVTLIQSAAALGPGFGATRVIGTRGTLWTDRHGVHLAEAVEAHAGADVGADVGNGHADNRLLETPTHLALPDLTELFGTSQPAGALPDMTSRELPPYIRLAETFRRAIEGAPLEPGPRPATFADGLAAMTVIEAVRRSAADGGRWITV